MYKAFHNKIIILKAIVSGNHNMYFQISFHKVASTCLFWCEAHVGLFRLLMKEIFDAYMLWLFGKKFVVELVTCTRSHDTKLVGTKSKNS